MCSRSLITGHTDCRARDSALTNVMKETVTQLRTSLLKIIVIKRGIRNHAKNTRFHFIQHLFIQLFIDTPVFILLLVHTILFMNCV